MVALREASERDETGEVSYIVTAENQVYMDSIDEELSTSKVEALIQRFSSDLISEEQRQGVSDAIVAFRNRLKQAVSQEGKIMTGFIGVLAGQVVRDALKQVE